MEIFRKAINECKVANKNQRKYNAKIFQKYCRIQNLSLAN